MSESDAGTQNLNIKIGDEELKGRYSNLLRITHTREEFILDFVNLVPPQGIKLTPRHYAYLKISEGCNHRCSFCIIPSMRGDLVSRPLADVVAEAKRLVDAGVREQTIFPEIKYDEVASIHGMDITIVTTAKTNDEGKALLKHLGMPFRA